MPFLDEVDAVREKIPDGRLSRPMLAGIVLLAVIIAVLAALGVASSARGDFVVDHTASLSSAAIETGASSATARDGASRAAGIAVAPTEEEQPPARCYVYVVGAVKAPGVYELPSDARVNDAVQAAGGLKKNADAAAVNLARAIVDGEQVYVPTEGESAATASNGAAVAPSTSAGGAGSSPAAPAGEKVNINTADASALQSLPGIGEVTAQKIIASREAEGPFATIDDLKRVSGIGEKKFAALADAITV
ncbi:MAG: ComEA family DNA-binding protein [Coriobacteriaceae bacterium]|nr:ComEA family DNA-binding protein [Coriobacteriaceae bacterium]